MTFPEAIVMFLFILGTFCAGYLAHTPPQSPAVTHVAIACPICHDRIMVPTSSIASAGFVIRRARRIPAQEAGSAMTMTDEMLKAVTEELETFAAMGSGYRAILERAGFSPTVSEQVAMMFLAEYQASIIRGIVK